MGALRILLGEQLVEPVRGPHDVARREVVAEPGEPLAGLEDRIGRGRLQAAAQVGEAGVDELVAGEGGHAVNVSPAPALAATRVEAEAAVLSDPRSARRLCPVPLSFCDLCTAMDATDVEVRVVLTEDDRHVVRLLDFHGLRSLDLQVDRGFGAVALLACCSLALCPDGSLARQRPELVALACTTVEPPGVGGSDRGRPERLSCGQTRP